MKLKDGQQLPTQSEKQPQGLPKSGYQSIAERFVMPLQSSNSSLNPCRSGVLAASIERSRHQWLTEGVFEKYWTKPTKKKGQIELPNPPRDSMTKLGHCSMIIEPHFFDIILYTMKDSRSSTPQPPVNPVTPSMQQYRPTYGAHPNPPIQNTVHKDKGFQSSNQSAFPNPQLTLPPFNEGFAQFGPPGIPSFRPTASPTSSTPTSGSQNMSNNTNNTTPISNADLDSQSTDPVIQMLATRAASDPTLKALMKIVASGKATQTQLQDFQKQIDELNQVLQIRKDPLKSEGPPKGLPPPHTPTATPKSEPTSQARPNSIASVAPTSASSPATNLTTGYTAPNLQTMMTKTEPLNQYYSSIPQFVKPKVPYTPKYEPTALVFEFSAGTGDRFLFPRHSILEYLPGGTQVIASFLITRKGSASTSGTYKPSVEYYQPVTVRLSTSNQRILEPIARILAPIGESREHMEHVMNRMMPAESVFLATQLPRPREIDVEDIEETDVVPVEDIVKTSYDAPSFLVPIVT